LGIVPGSPVGAAANDLWTLLWTYWTKVQSSDGRRPEKSEIGLNEMQSLDREFESNSTMQSLHRASFASAGEYDRKTAASPPLPLPLSPGNYPPVNGGGNLSSYRTRGITKF